MTTPDHAIVIGIDRYDQSKWNLRAAVRDATAFARWVISDGAGRATPETLTLLLSPLEGVTPSLPATGPATRDELHKAFARYALAKSPVAAERLWVYYAGHGIAPPGGGVDAAPVLVPSDAEENLEDYLFNNPLDLAKYLRPLQLKAPAVQLFFVDCCRGIVDATNGFTASTQLHFDLGKLGPQAASRQAVLYATTAGTLANELGLHGLFSGALLEGLGGRAELVADPARQELVLTIDRLAAYTARRVRAKTDEATQKGGVIVTQVPSPSLLGTTGELALARFTPDSVPRATLGLVVDPTEAAAGAQAGLCRWDPMAMEFVVAAVRTSSDGFRWQLPLGTHHLDVRAMGRKQWRKAIELDRDLTERAELAAGEPIGLESVEAIDPMPIEIAPGGKGSLTVEADDHFTGIEVFDPTGASIAVAQHKVLCERLAVGSYRVRIVNPGEPPDERSVLVTAGSREYVRAARPGGSPVVERAAEELHMSPNGGLAFPSEAFGPTTLTRIGSLLAWGAWAARASDGAGWGHKLRSVGVTIPADARVVVLVGDAALAGPLLPALSLRAGKVGAELPVAYQNIPALQEHAVQWASADPTVESVVIEAPGIGGVAVPIAAIPGHVHVAVIAREVGGEIELHRHLMPASGAPVGDPREIRASELNWRALATRSPIAPRLPTDGRLIEAGSDPLALAVLGYRRARAGLPLGFIVARLQQIAGELADTHVLAALAEPQERELHVRRAEAAGTPLVAEGAALLSTWLTATAQAAGAPPPVPTRPWLDTRPWTMFDAATMTAPRVQGVLPTTALAPGSRPWADRLLTVAAATGRMENVDPTAAPYTGTGFAAAPGLVLTAHLVVSRWPRGWRVRLGERTVALASARVLGRAPGIAVALLAGDAGAAPTLSFAPPRVGQRIAVVGYPGTKQPAHDTARMLSPSVSDGAQAIALGVVKRLSDDGSAFEYDAWALAGAAGGPVVDLDSGAVLGVHHGSRFVDEEQATHGVGIPLSFLQRKLDFS